MCATPLSKKRKSSKSDRLIKVNSQKSTTTLTRPTSHDAAYGTPGRSDGKDLLWTTSPKNSPFGHQSENRSLKVQFFRIFFKKVLSCWPSGRTKSQGCQKGTLLFKRTITHVFEGAETQISQKRIFQRSVLWNNGSLTEWTWKTADRGRIGSVIFEHDSPFFQRSVLSWTPSSQERFLGQGFWILAKNAWRLRERSLKKYFEEVCPGHRARSVNRKEVLWRSC